MTADEIEILLVEDDPADVELTLHAFRHNHLANPIQVVNDGEEALDYLFARGAYRGRTLERPLKLVLLDLKLPKVDGLEVLRAIKGDPGLKVTPVVVLTSSLQEKDLVESYHLGVNSYIQKPVDFNRFLEVVKSLGPHWLLVNQAPPSFKISAAGPQ
ncbi:MAG TPA: response regulator [Candidatus Acidoferrales bacterium]|nr:response regulator [Candidatus Acidoferrales bacterium]